MGLLDDAIREHLELKRRHGADPDEVAREEREALGAPRRGEFAQPAGGDVAEGVATAEAAPLPAAGAPPLEAAEEAPVTAEQIAEPAPPLEESPLAGEPVEEPAPPPPPAAGHDEGPWLEDDEPDQVPAGETLEHPAPAPAEGEDVLEETPEFLQETPEHERLWFEQKPPRGFDWDK